MLFITQYVGFVCINKGQDFERCRREPTEHIIARRLSVQNVRLTNYDKLRWPTRRIENPVDPGRQVIRSGFNSWHRPIA